MFGKLSLLCKVILFFNDGNTVIKGSLRQDGFITLVLLFTGYMNRRICKTNLQPTTKESAEEGMHLKEYFDI